MYTVSIEFVKKLVHVPIFLNDLPSNSRIELPKFSFLTSLETPPSGQPATGSLNHPIAIDTGI